MTGGRHECAAEFAVPGDVVGDGGGGCPPGRGGTTGGARADAAGALEQSTAIPDFSGIWRHGSLPWFVPPASGPGPVTNRARRRTWVSDYGKLVGDYTNPILQPWAADRG